MTYEAWRISYQSSEQPTQRDWHAERCEDAMNECDALRAKIEAMEKQEPFDADSDVFRSAFEAALKAGNWPATRQGDGYRAAYTHIAWRIAFSTVNRLKLYLAPGAQLAPSVPEGWKLVPIEPTNEMRNAWDSSPICEDDDAEFRRAYSEMLAAAPEGKP